MHRLKHIWFIILLFLLPIGAHAQINRLEVRLDTIRLIWPDHAIRVKQEKKLPLPYHREDEVCEISVSTEPGTKSLELIPSNDFELIDSLLKIGDNYRFKVRFRDLTRSDFLKFSFTYVPDTGRLVQDIALQPITDTRVNVKIRDDELFIGEEKVFEIITSNPGNILYTSDWVNTGDFEYRITEESGSLLLHVVPQELGRKHLEIPFNVRKPFMDDKGNLKYEISGISSRFFVRASRLQFLNIDQNEITLDETTRLQGVEAQISNSRLLQMGKTYRVESQEDPGGALIAEIFTKQHLANNKVLCLIRPYNYHRKSQGYLYIKDGDDAKFITNFGITHATAIERISILREGGEWRESNTIYPGEEIELKIEGKGLHKARFYFEDLVDVSEDTLVRSENQLFYKLRVPVDIPRKSVNIYNYSEATGKVLKVSEYQEPRDFDFLYVNYGGISRRVSSIRGPVLYEKTIKDVVFSFNPQAIDDRDELFGKQYLTVDLRITGRKNELVEMRTIDNIVVCPGSSSPRFDYYSTGDCRTDEISLNKFLSRKTYDLDEWSRINMTIHHKDNKYSEDGYEKEIEIILKRRYSFDIEVSFPAGLITISKQDSGEIGFGSLSGISMAMIAQFSFYHPEKIAKYRPYKIGAGFLAFNAFNFSDNVDNRDVGIVILGSLYPTTRDVKLSFPLYVGGGYFLKDRKWFFLIGPGIRVKL